MNNVYKTIHLKPIKPPRPPLANSIKELQDYAKVDKLDTSIKLKLYLNSCINLFNHGSEALISNDYELAYVYYMKSINLYCKLHKKYPEYKITINSDPTLFQLHGNVSTINYKALEQLELLQPKLIQYYKKQAELQKKIMHIEVPKLETVYKYISDQKGIDKTQLAKLYPNTEQELQKFIKFREIIIPDTLVTQFAQIANKNTSSGIETCGIISGKFKENQIIVTHLVIPKQVGTTTSCTSINEEDIYTFHTEFNLVIIGWIHTHPEFDCFLSSVDLHMQAGYQTLLPEAIAIVYSPSKRFQKKIGIFRLNKYGLNIIRKCDKGTTFHNHSENGLYSEAKHVKQVSSTIVPLNIKYLDKYNS